jgi:hypothetical protein
MGARIITEGETLKRQHKLRRVPDLSTLPDDAFLVRSQVSQLTGFTEQALKKWAREGRGPKVTTIEGRPRYRVADFRDWTGRAA